MTEQVKTISEARQSLPKLSQAAQTHMARVLITNQGKPQSVLIGYEDYRSMVASHELARRPEELRKIAKGLQQIREGKVLTFEQLQEAVKVKRAKVRRPRQLVRAEQTI
jgi:prevent-host-death family protein